MQADDLIAINFWKIRKPDKPDKQWLADFSFT